MALFGSHARGDARENSDTGILVDFSPGADLKSLSGLKLSFEDVSGRPVDALADGQSVRNSGKQSLQMRLIYEKPGPLSP
ncbi:MAG: nucleotidyltransferase domain-containing protein [Methanospirillum sp.]|nr:nucleotidyltransferase domain-containing protein [Methanospirillum sp.]